MKEEKRQLSIRFGCIVQRKERKTFCSRFVAMIPIAGVAVVKVSRKKTFQGLRGKEKDTISDEESFVLLKRNCICQFLFFLSTVIDLTEFSLFLKPLQSFEIKIQ